MVTKRPSTQFLRLRAHSSAIDIRVEPATPSTTAADATTVAPIWLARARPGRLLSRPPTTDGADANAGSSFRVIGVKTKHRLRIKLSKHVCDGRLPPDKGKRQATSARLARTAGKLYRMR